MDTTTGEWWKFRKTMQLVAGNATSSGGRGLLITPGHPVRTKGSQWCKPFRLAPAQQLPCEYVYNCVLSRGHTILVGNFECVTLGHGLTGAVVADSYYSTARVVDDLKAKPGWDDGWIENESSICQCGEKGRTEGEQQQQQVLESWVQANDLVVDGTLLSKMSSCWTEGISFIASFMITTVSTNSSTILAIVTSSWAVR